MTLQARKAQREAEEKQEQIKQYLKWLWLIPLAILGFLVYILLPRINQVLDKVQNPSLRSDVVHICLLSNSKSDVIPLSQVGRTVGRTHKQEVSYETDAIVTALKHRLGAVQTKIIRFASRPVDIYSGVNDPTAILAIVNNFYLNANPDPQPGTHLVPALQYALQNIPRNTNVILTIGTDMWEDTAATSQYFRSIKNTHPNLIIWVYGVPIHNVQRASHQLDLRGAASANLLSLTYVKITSSNDFYDALDRWLPECLRAKAVPMN